MIAELLGDVGPLLDRVEALQSALPSAVDEAVRKVRAAGETAAGAVEASGDVFLGRFNERASKATQAMQGAATDVQNAAKVVDRSAFRFALMAGLIGLAAGTLGGALVALAIAHKLFGG
ncbi:hypothetical protein [Burkholderia latens]|uniref:hypothetical protein n=1 Tax=Burkholderia latens TaxID=488446 RepID=UPI0039A58BE9